MPTLRARKDTQEGDKEHEKGRKRPAARRSSRQTIGVSEASTASKQHKNLLKQMEDDSLVSSPKHKKKVKKITTAKKSKSAKEGDEGEGQWESSERPAARRVTRRTIGGSEASTESKENENMLPQVEDDSSPNERTGVKKSTARPRKNTEEEDEDHGNTGKSRKRQAARKIPRRRIVASETSISTESEEDETLLAQMNEDLSRKETEMSWTKKRTLKKMKIEDKSKDEVKMNVEKKTRDKVNGVIEVMLEDMENLTMAGGQDTEEISISLTQKKEEKVEILNAGHEGLYGNYQETRRLGEEFAVEYLTNTVNHPVLTCFRELTGPDINRLLATQKMKKLMGAVPLSLVYMGLIDYMAVTIDNPLYVDDTPFRAPMKNVPAKVTKVMNEFKSTLTSWGISDYSAWKGRYSTAMSFLQAQIPRFQGIQFDETFAGMLTSVEAEISRSKQKYDFMTSGTKKVADPEKSQVSSASPVRVQDKTNSDLEMIDVTSNSETESSLASPKSTRTWCEPGPSKKLRLEESPKERENKTAEVSISFTVKKPQVNAFALLMSKSKEIAEQKKQKKLLDTPPPRPRMPVSH